MFHKFQVVVLLLLVPLIGSYLYLEKENISLNEFFSSGTSVVHIGEIPLKVEIVKTDADRERGLSGRERMSTDGMLFVFEKSDIHSIWMKGMLFPIDIIWIDESLTVVGVDRGVRPDTFPRTFRPPVPVLYAVETEEHYTETFGIDVGDKVRLPFRLDDK